MDAARAVDALLEAPIAPSFSRIGYEARRRLQSWSDLDAYDLTDRVMAVTGATSGLGRAAAEQLARDGATVLADGTEATIASQVVGPTLLTSLLLERLGGSAPGRVITVSSGGMYTAGLTVRRLQMDASDYHGSKQYALAKRAQVTLNEMWAERVDPGSVVFHSMHPGWADTPGVQESLPTFRRIVGPLLRDADQGADTMVWLARELGPVLVGPTGPTDPPPPQHSSVRHPRTPSRAVGLGDRPGGTQMMVSSGL